MGEAAWIKTVPDARAEGKVKKVYDQVAAERGSNFNIVRAASLWPELLDLQEQEFELFTGPSTRIKSEIRDLIAARIAMLNNCQYCNQWYRRALIVRGWSDEKITHILQDLESDHLSMTDKAIVKFADKITRNPQSMTADDIDELRQSGLDDRMILEAAALTGYYNYMTLLANALGVMAES